MNTLIFNQYLTQEGIPFYLINKSVHFPQDDSLEIYGFVTVDDDTPWTILSYKIYNTISYWWVLQSLNKDSIFYAKGGETIKIIKPSYIDEVMSHV